MIWLDFVYTPEKKNEYYKEMYHKFSGNAFSAKAEYIIKELWHF